MASEIHCEGRISMIWLMSAEKAKGHGGGNASASG